MSLSGDAQSEQPNKNANQAATSTSLTRADSELRLIDLLLVIGKSRWMIVRSMLVCGVIAALLSLALPNIYVATARILPPQQAQSTATVLLGQLSSIGSATAGTSVKSPSELYVALLQSRSIADALIARYNLQSVYKSSRMSDVRKSLAADSSFSAGSDGLIEIAVSSRDPERAATLANGYVDALKTLLSSLAVTSASQRRLFLETQFRNVKEDLSRAEIAMEELQETTGLVQMDAQMKASIDAFYTLKAQIATQEVQVRMMKSYETNQNDDVSRSEEELAALRAQLAKLEHGGAEHRVGDITITGKSTPSVELEYERRMRDLKYYEGLYEIIGKEYESAKLDEAKDFASVQVVDTAVKPDKKNRPKRSAIVLLTMLLAGIFSGMYAFIREAAHQECQDPDQAARWHELASYFRVPVPRFARKF